MFRGLPGPDPVLLQFQVSPKDFATTKPSGYSSAIPKSVYNQTGFPRQDRLPNCRDPYIQRLQDRQGQKMKVFCASQVFWCWLCQHFDVPRLVIRIDVGYSYFTKMFLAS